MTFQNFTFLIKQASSISECSLHHHREYSVCSAYTGELARSKQTHLHSYYYIIDIIINQHCIVNTRCLECYIMEYKLRRRMLYFIVHLARLYTNVRAYLQTAEYWSWLKHCIICVAVFVIYIDINVACRMARDS